MDNRITKIAELGHEIGYHYEELTTTRGNFEEAFELFKANLLKIRRYYDVVTISMHGSPLSKFDNKIIWDKYDYKELGIIGEPYFDIDYYQIAYFTDVGRRWNGDKVSVRDKVKSRYNFNFKTTQKIIDNIDQLPPKILFTIHPQRWHDIFVLWCKELVLQNVKNILKRLLYVR